MNTEQTSQSGGESATSVPPTPPPLQKNTGMAMVAYILFFVPLLTDAKNDPFVKYHVKQGLVLFLGWVAVSILSMTPLFFIGWLLNIALFILFVVGILHAVHGEEKPLPFIGQFAEQFTF